MGQPEFKPVAFAVNGTLMRGLELNQNLLEIGATFSQEIHTEPCYKLWSMGDEYPAMQRVKTGGQKIALELWNVPPSGLVTILQQEPPGLCIGKVYLETGEQVLGVLGEGICCDDGQEITQYGGWRNYIKTLKELDREERLERMLAIAEQNQLGEIACKLWSLQPYFSAWVYYGSWEFRSPIPQKSPGDTATYVTSFGVAPLLRSGIQLFLCPQNLTLLYHKSQPDVEQFIQDLKSCLPQVPAQKNWLKFKLNQPEQATFFITLFGQFANLF
ncbi:gamma-glutamylcyclotransferase [Spirulina subsalsa FACHB-351]|uniref:Gamma-glutamylcyclotransferase n=1 Tax=Spirulina subsalsa FACHB-351 TaxID=234711 RepID=A0ABT3L1J6_9CYAN|nr:gamma-glutamylcyclotransferase [Spirulina subsalsa]MCW6035356.1 gamma-glutamylcyclotransferase [Spirulina subsalsa FACHB-351]